MNGGGGRPPQAYAGSGAACKPPPFSRDGTQSQSINNLSHCTLKFGIISQLWSSLWILLSQRDGLEAQLIVTYTPAAVSAVCLSVADTIDG